MRLEFRGYFHDPSTLGLYEGPEDASPVDGSLWNAIEQMFKGSDQPHHYQQASPYSWPCNETIAALLGWLTKVFPDIEFKVIDTTSERRDWRVMAGSASEGRDDIRCIDEFSASGLGLTSKQNVIVQNLWRSLRNAGEVKTYMNLREMFKSEGILL